MAKKMKVKKLEQINIQIEKEDREWMEDQKNITGKVSTFQLHELIEKKRKELNNE